MNKSPHQIRMPVQDWFKVPDNPRQRNTEKHAKKASRPGGHLRVASPVHAQVFAAEFPDGKMMKLDGHTRAWLWERQTLDAPDELLVTVIPVKDENDVKTFYTHFDDSRAAETSQEKLSGALREYDVELKSGCFAHLYPTALTTTHAFVFPGAGRQSLYQIVGEWKPVLEAMDRLDYPKAPLVSVQSAMFMGFMRYAGTKSYSDMLDFWKTFYNGEKSGTAGRWLPAEALRYLLKMEKSRGAGPTASDRWTMYALSAMDRHIEGKWYRGMNEPKGFNRFYTRSDVIEWAKPIREKLLTHSMKQIAKMMETGVKKK